jgi:hypothetical protein
MCRRALWREKRWRGVGAGWWRGERACVSLHVPVPVCVCAGVVGRVRVRRRLCWREGFATARAVVGKVERDSELGCMGKCKNSPSLETCAPLQAFTRPVVETRVLGNSSRSENAQSGRLWLPFFHPFPRLG